MKQRFIVMTLGLLLTILSKAQSVDSLSYALGYYTTKDNFSLESCKWEKTPDNYNLLFKGLEESICAQQTPSDSSTFVSYMMGQMQAVFLHDSFKATKEDLRPSKKYMIIGLRKVVNDSIQLPQDTIAISSYLKKHSNYKKLNKEEKETFSTYYGIMKGLQPGLQQLIDEMKPGIKANQKAYAAGMADMLEMALAPESPYTMGKAIGRSFVDSPIRPTNKEDFILGVKAAASLAPRLLSEKQMNDVIERQARTMEKQINELEEKQ